MGEPNGYGSEPAKPMGLEHEQLLEHLPTATGMVADSLVSPDEVAAFVAYLASPRAGSPTGAERTIHGGAIKSV